MNVTLLTASKDSCSMFKESYKQVKILDKKQKNLYTQKYPQFGNRGSEHLNPEFKL